MRSVTNIYLVNLAITDLMLSVICMPPTLISNLVYCWLFGPILCKVFAYLQRKIFSHFLLRSSSFRHTHTVHGLFQFVVGPTLAICCSLQRRTYQNCTSFSEFPLPRIVSEWAMIKWLGERYNRSKAAPLPLFVPQFWTQIRTMTAASSKTQSLGDQNLFENLFLLFSAYVATHTSTRTCISPNCCVFGRRLFLNFRPEPANWGWWNKCTY